MRSAQGREAKTCESDHCRDLRPPRRGKAGMGVLPLDGGSVQGRRPRRADLYTNALTAVTGTPT